MHDVSHSITVRSHTLECRCALESQFLLVLVCLALKVTKQSLCGATLDMAQLTGHRSRIAGPVWRADQQEAIRHTAVTTQAWITWP